MSQAEQVSESVSSENKELTSEQAIQSIGESAVAPSTDLAPSEVVAGVTSNTLEQNQELQTSKSQTPSQDELIAQGLLVQIQNVVKWEDLSKIINDWAQWKGWNDVERTSREVTLLFKSEVMEAFEEYRKGQFEVYFSVDSQGVKKPEGFYTEIADLAIRVLHKIGQDNADQGHWWTYRPEDYKILDWNDPLEVCWSLDTSCWVSIDAMRDVLVICKTYLGAQGRDLMTLIKQKMEYNLTRPYRHGNKAS